MNNVSLTGRLTREPELRYGGQDNSTAITRFTLAVDDGKDTDFINIKCFGRTAEWAQKWLSKGSKAEVTGKIKTGSYESQRTGGKVYYTEVVANSVGFGESKAEAEARGQQLPESDGFMNIPEGADEDDIFYWLIHFITNVCDIDLFVPQAFDSCPITRYMMIPIYLSPK